MAKYKVLQGLDYPPSNRAEAGDIVEDLPTKSVAWLLEVGAIEAVDAKPATKSKTEFKADATDGDGDGLVQDGTPFERPVGEE
jgi:hypothetical protein